MLHGRFGEMNSDFSFYKGKNVFVTGHTGFKGAWLCKILEGLGANVTGFALNPLREPSIYNIIGLHKRIISVIGDIRDFTLLKSCFDKARPEIVFHLAAQPLVLPSYNNPLATYETNVMGTVNLLCCIKETDFLKSFVNITTDKVYFNNEWEWGYRENDALDGFDPYSNSKSCSELITNCFKRSFFIEKKIGVSTLRAGNVIGGGDFTEGRIIPDCIKAAVAGEKIKVKNPSSIRPYQHVLEPLFAYLRIAEAQYKNWELSGQYNIGPDESDCLTTGELADLFCKEWGKGVSWEHTPVNQNHEAYYLKLDCSKIKAAFQWKPTWDIKAAVKKTVEWAEVYYSGGNVGECMDRQISEFLNA